MARVLIIFLLAIVGTGAVFGGGALIVDPSGGSIGLSVEILKYSPFSNFFIPGHLLFNFLGIGSLLACFIVIKKTKGYPIWTMIIGFTLTIWIAVQMMMLRDVQFLQIIFGSIGISLIILGILERNRIFRKSR